MLVFFFKQKTAYEMRISDWSSDVCSSDLCRHGKRDEPAGRQVPVHVRRGRRGNAQRGQPTRSNARMDTQRGEPKPDIIEPSAPPETPVPPQPRETPMPNAPEIIPSQPDFVPGVRPEEYPASA